MAARETTRPQAQKGGRESEGERRKSERFDPPGTSLKKPRARPQVAYERPCERILDFRKLSKN